MRVSYRATASAALLLAFAAVPLPAQSFRGALGLYGGGSMYTDFFPGSSLLDANMEPGWIGGLQIERWAGRGRIGLRLNASYAEREFSNGDFNVYAGNLDFLVRLLSPQPSRFIAPYVAVGGGLVHYNAAFDTSAFGGLYPQDPVTKPAAVVGLGADLFAGSPVGIQLEIADHMVIESPFDAGTGEAFRPVHQAMFRVAIQLRSDRLDPPAPVMAFSRASSPIEELPEAPPMPDPEPAPESSPQPPVESGEFSESRESGSALALGSVTAALDANTAELANLRRRVAELERALEQGWVAGSASPIAAATGSNASGLFTVQIAAFRTGDPARRLAEQMRSTRLPIWVSQVMVNGRQYFRVRLGALSSLAEARQLAQYIEREYSTLIWVAPVERSETLPPNAIPATRAFLGATS